MEANEMQKKASFKTAPISPAAWGLAFLTVGGELAATLYYSPFSVSMPALVIALVIVGFFAEAALIGLIGNRMRGELTGLVDSMMTALVNLPRLLFARIILLLIPAAYMAISTVLLPLLSANETMILIVAIGLFPLLVYSQIVGFFAVCYIVVLNYGAADAISQSIQDLRNRAGRIVLRISPLIAIDAAIIAALILTGLVTYRSTFILTITEAMAENNATALVSSVRQGQAGDYMVVNRLANSFMDGILHTRGLDLSGIAVFVIQQKWAGILLVILSIPLSLLRIGIQERAFFDLCAGATARTNAQWKEREENLRDAREIRIIPSGETDSSRT